MSKQDNLDKNRQIRMAEAAIIGGERLAVLANQSASNPLAHILWCRLNGTPEVPALADQVTQATRNFFDEVCLFVSLSELPVKQCSDFTALSIEHLAKATPESIKVRATVGQWPTRLKYPTLFEGKKDRFEFISLLRRTNKEYPLGETRLYALAAYLWQKHFEAIDEEIYGNRLYDLLGEAHFRNFYGREAGGYHERGNAEFMARSFMFAISYGFVSVPEDAHEGVVDTFGRIAKDFYKSFDPRCSILAAMVDLTKVTEEQLQGYATFAPAASNELGRRGIPLLIPARQNADSFIEGARKTVRWNLCDNDHEVNYGKYCSTESVIEKYVLFDAYDSYSAPKEHSNDDPFGEPLHLFTARTGEVAPEKPTYEQWVEYVTTHKLTPAPVD